MNTPLKVKIVTLGHFDERFGFPRYQTAGASGIDLRAMIDSDQWILRPGDRKLIPTGLSMEIPHGFEGQLRLRSSVGLKKGLLLPNAPGTIDSDYRGEVKVLLANFTGNTQLIERGERICQIVFVPVTQVELIPVSKYEELDQSERGVGGFGSTGSH